ncbi:MAG TPA: hypothetical protein PLA24_11335 [Tenuifilaceae bacterium]|nr:hypothetical protein [Tenuifilaceae bacterium]
MKFLNTFAIIFLLVNLTFLPEAKSQNLRKKETCLISFKVNIDSDYQYKFSEFAGIFPEPGNKKVNKVENLIKYTTWDILKEKLTNQLGMIIIPLNAYGNKFSYDDFGFPDISISRALNKGRSKQYIKVELEIHPEHSAKYITKIVPDSANKIVELKENEVKPQVTINLTVYSDKGIIPKASGSGTANCKEVIVLDDSFFDGIANGNVQPGKINLYNLIDRAAQNLIGSF